MTVIQYDLEGVVNQCLEDSEDWFPEQAKDVAFQTLCLAGEVGELANLVKKVARGTHTEAELMQRMEEETTDVFIYLCNIIGLLGMDPFAKYNEVRAKNAERFVDLRVPDRWTDEDKKDAE
jgi:NTP pyrophosphatase (non-canonical NTP hydrolase)